MQCWLNNLNESLFAPLCVQVVTVDCFGPFQTAREVSLNPRSKLLYLRYEMSQKYRC